MRFFVLPRKSSLRDGEPFFVLGTQFISARTATEFLPLAIERAHQCRGFNLNAAPIWP